VSTTHIELGRLDTIGGTTYDLQCCGPARRSACFAPGYGTHALWMRSADLTGSYWDLDMCYNFCDTAAYSWSWIDPDYMQSGVNVFPYRTGAGCMACEPATGVAVVSGYAPPILPPVAVKEMPSAECRMPNAGPTIMSGAEVQGLSSKVVFDALGRRALNPASGVYFVREQSVVSSQHSGTEHGARNTEYDGRLRKVVLTE